MQNKIYKIIVLGASIAGYDIMHALYKNTEEQMHQNIAFVSRNFRQPNLYQNEITADIVYMDYGKGLIKLVAKDNKATYYCERLVLTLGTCPTKLNITSNNISYRRHDLIPAIKNGELVIFGNGQEAIKAATDLAKKFKYIYICTKEFELRGHARTLICLKQYKNIIHLPNCHITACKNTETGDLREVTLSTFETLHATNILAITDRLAETAWLNQRMLSLTDEKKICINSFGQCAPVSTMYAYGECAAEPIGHIHLLDNIINSLIASL